MFEAHPEWNEVIAANCGEFPGTLRTVALKSSVVQHPVSREKTIYDDSTSHRSHLRFCALQFLRQNGYLLWKGLKPLLMAFRRIKTQLFDSGLHPCQYAEGV